MLFGDRASLERRQPAGLDRGHRRRAGWTDNPRSHEPRSTSAIAVRYPQPRTAIRIPCDVRAYSSTTNGWRWSAWRGSLRDRARHLVGSATTLRRRSSSCRATRSTCCSSTSRCRGSPASSCSSGSDRKSAVVFTTAYDRYALEAFGVSSIDYLLKPIESERLDRALDKLERCRGPPTACPRARARAGGPADAGRRLERIASRVGERTTVLEVARIGHSRPRTS